MTSSPSLRPQLYIFGDYGPTGTGDNTWARVTAVLLQRCRNLGLDVGLPLLQPTPQLDTGSAPAFIIADLMRRIEEAKQNNGKDVMLINIAPRRSDKANRKGNDGEAFVYFRTQKGIEGITTYNERVLQELKPLLAAVHPLNTDAERQRILEASQFRSMEFAPRYVAEVAAADYSLVCTDVNLLGEIEDSEAVDLATTELWLPDDYGNCKLTLPLEVLELQAGSGRAKAVLEIEGETYVAHVAREMFAGDRHSQELTLSGGSAVNGKGETLAQLFAHDCDLAEHLGLSRVGHDLGAVPVVVREIVRDADPRFDDLEVSLVRRGRYADKVGCRVS